MEHLLIKLARQLDAMDEASLMSLWDKYAATVSRFEPSRRWEEAALVFSLIQAKRWKNQLFNYHWSQQVRPVEGAELPQNSFTLEPAPKAGQPGPGEGGSPGLAQAEPPKRCKVLGFRPARPDQHP